MMKLDLILTLVTLSRLIVLIEGPSVIYNDNTISFVLLIIWPHKVPMIGSKKEKGKHKFENIVKKRSSSSRQARTFFHADQHCNFILQLNFFLFQANLPFTGTESLVSGLRWIEDLL